MAIERMQTAPSKEPRKRKRATKTVADIKKTKKELGLDKLDEGIEGDVMPDTKHDRFGRPTVMTETIKHKVKEAYAIGCSVKEVARWADISPQTLYNYFKKDPEFKEYCEDLKHEPIMHARNMFVKAAKESPYFALKLLERLKPDEFSPKVRAAFTEPEDLTEDEIEIVNQLIEANLK